MNPSDPSAITILFATETCNAEDLSESAENTLVSAGYTVVRHSVSEIEAEELCSKPVVLVIASTWGEGEPPTDAEDFHAELISKEPVGLTATQFSALALGDSSYECFCQCGKDFDEQLVRHGAKRLLARVDCDVDFEDSYDGWITTVLGA